ncbi:uncharacterized protein LOC132171366 [Corylus avellana]|uniref:uncharacterized protein LOC132171366 n=1 Tax=Corylus avellana TaxID=13451 RepID=UPI00286CB35B|nr:uncharacterized protein LOC132171366 [Corylus avellana]
MEKDLVKLKDLYESILTGTTEDVIAQYENLPKPLPHPLTPRNNSILHVAIFMERESLAREILKKYSDPGDLLAQKSDHGHTILHEVAGSNMTSLAKEILRLAPDLLLKTTSRGETPLFRAAHFGHTKMFMFLADEMDRRFPNAIAVRPHLQRDDETTILHTAVLAEFFDLALEIARRYEHLSLASTKDRNGMTALQLLSDIPSAFKSGRNYGPLKRFIYYCVPSADEDTKKEEYSNRGDTRESDQGPKLPPNYDVCMQCFFVVVRILISGWLMTERICKEKRKHESAFKLASFLIQKDLSWTESGGGEDPGKISIIDVEREVEVKEDLSWTESGVNEDQGQTSSLGLLSDEQGGVEGGHGSRPGETTVPPETTEGTGSSCPTGGNEGTPQGNKIPPTLTPLLLATSTGIVEIVKEILRVYPQAVEHESCEGQNILHVAIKHRRLEIYRHVKKMDIPMHMLARRIDSDGHTLLHLVGHMQGYAGGRTQSGPAFQLQEELRWLERVRKLIPDHYQMHRRRQGKGESADEHFEKTHEEFLKKVQDWLKKQNIIPHPDQMDRNNGNGNGETADELFEKTHKTSQGGTRMADADLRVLLYCVGSYCHCGICCGLHRAGRF